MRPRGFSAVAPPPGSAGGCCLAPRLCVCVSKCSDIQTCHCQMFRYSSPGGFSNIQNKDWFFYIYNINILTEQPFCVHLSLHSSDESSLRLPPARLNTHGPRHILTSASLSTISRQIPIPKNLSLHVTRPSSSATTSQRHLCLCYKVGPHL